MNKTCDTCKHRANDTYDPPCDDCGRSPEGYSNWESRSLDDCSPSEWDLAARAARGVVSTESKASDRQVGGSHYKDFAIQPAEFLHKNGIPYLEGCAIKYLVRWREKGGKQDLEKAKHYIDLLIEMES